MGKYDIQLAHNLLLNELNLIKLSISKRKAPEEMSFFLNGISPVEDNKGIVSCLPWEALQDKIQTTQSAN
jgi:hypothetical protein